MPTLSHLSDSSLQSSPITAFRSSKVKGTGSARIDWIFGSEGVEFSAYAAMRGGLLDKATDHPLVLARVG